jgi:hypothetical protein
MLSAERFAVKLQAAVRGRLSASTACSTATLRAIPVAPDDEFLLSTANTLPSTNIGAALRSAILADIRQAIEPSIKGDILERT